MEMIRSLAEQEALNSIANLLRLHIGDSLIAEFKAGESKEKKEIDHGKIYFDPILGRPAYFPNEETKRTIVEVIAGDEQEKLWAFVTEEYDICNVNKDYVLDITEIDDFLNRMLDYL